MSTFSWQNLKKPFFALAPMEDVTDTVFRQMVILCGRPDVFFTEFTSCDSIFSNGFKKVIHRFQYSKNEHPIIAQVWGNNPELYFKVGKLIKELGFDGIDINMGCPDKNVVAKGCCSGLIQNQKLAKEIIDAAREGAGDLPLSVKTRLGYTKIQTDEWIGFLLSQHLEALSIHLRTVKELSKTPAHWEEMEKIIHLRDEINKHTVIIGNGDIKSIDEAKLKHKTYGVEGIMIGRGIFQNPWVFNSAIDPSKMTPKDKLRMLKIHVELYDKTWKGTKNFGLMKKFYKMYVENFRNATQYRIDLMKFGNAQDTIKYLSTCINNF